MEDAAAAGLQVVAHMAVEPPVVAEPHNGQRCTVAAVEPPLGQIAPEVEPVVAVEGMAQVLQEALPVERLEAPVASVAGVVES